MWKFEKREGNYRNLNMQYDSPKNVFELYLRSPRCNPYSNPYGTITVLSQGTLPFNTVRPILHHS